MSESKEKRKCGHLGCDKEVTDYEVNGLCPKHTKCLEEAIQDEMKDMEAEYISYSDVYEPSYYEVGR